MNDNQINDIVIFRTGQRSEMEKATNLLKEKGIPCHIREETSGGLQAVRPATSTAEPGVEWCLLVSRTNGEQAIQELAVLPLRQGPVLGVQDIQPRLKVKLAWKIYAVLLLLVPVVAWLLWIWKR